MKKTGRLQEPGRYDILKNMREKMIISILALSLIANSVFVYRNFHARDKQELAQKQYPFLSKRIFASNQNDIIINFIPLRQTLREYVEKQEDKVGVYFEYLPSGTSIGVNDKKEVRLASLSKVPLVMAIFKKIERGKLSLDNVLTVRKENLNDHFGTLWEKGAGTKLSVSDLVKLALAESDDTAYNVLFDQLTVQEINETYNNLDIQVNLDPDGGRTLTSPKSYSSIFRSLYLSSFLSNEHSNAILNTLTQTAFNDKIPAGVPDSVKVAHKIGVFESPDTSQDVFIDCGIVYVPNRPYILCTFVLDTNEQAQKHISTLSKMIYEYVTTIKGGD